MLRKFWKIISKTSLVALLLKKSNYPIHSLITIGKLTPSQIFPLFVLRILKLGSERLWWNHNLTKVAETFGSCQEI